MSNLSTNFEQALKDIELRGLESSMPDRVQISIGKDIDEVRSIMAEWMRHFLNGKPIRANKEPYKKIAEWLLDNQGLGLFMYGLSSQGKTFMSRYVLPAIISQKCNKIVHFYTMTEANQKIDEVLKYHLLSIDDIGVEEQSVSFGQRRNVFDEIMDAVEKHGKLIIITTNLSLKQIEERYGTRTLERIKATTKAVLFDLREDGKPVSFRY